MIQLCYVFQEWCRSDIVQIRSESEVIVTTVLSSLTMFDVLISPPKLMLVLSKFHWSPVVVVVAEGAPMGINPQWGPSIDRSIWMLWVCVLGSRKIKQSSDRSMILLFGKRWSTLMFPISWSNLPPRAPRAKIHRLDLLGMAEFSVIKATHLCKSVVSWSCDSSTIWVPILE